MIFLRGDYNFFEDPREVLAPIEESVTAISKFAYESESCFRRAGVPYGIRKEGSYGSYAEIRVRRTHNEFNVHEERCVVVQQERSSAFFHLVRHTCDALQSSRNVSRVSIDAVAMKNDNTDNRKMELPDGTTRVKTSESPFTHERE